MQDLQVLLQSYGNWLVFLNVLLEQAGLPIPAYPILIAAGAMSGGYADWMSAWLLAAVACWAADSVWYWAGGRYGGRLLSTICKMSLSQDSCIRQTQKLFLRIGVQSLLVCKFLPGAGALTTVMAGFAGTPYRRFAVFEAIGALIWSGSALLLGVLFRDVVNDLIDMIDQYGKWGLLLLLFLFVVYVVVRAFRRWMLVRSLSVIPRLSVDELLKWQADGRMHVVIDVRPGPDSMPRIPGAIVTDLQSPMPELDLEDDDPIVVYCSCPNEVSAAKLAARLRAARYRNTWALTGGYEEWQRKTSCLAEHNA
jgi:membrane protein DedA with SNARE-associated domain/rhodanese-related sulfurtransferase